MNNNGGAFTITNALKSWGEDRTLPLAVLGRNIFSPMQDAAPRKSPIDHSFMRPQTEFWMAACAPPVGHASRMEATC
ncbi:hypothetical protein SAMN05660745_02031 [Corynebacterium glucuronolyticum]|nr:hypothetical protein CGLUCO_05965 [Corynebacterium glucuronolyticum DSM 44120]SMB78684.1 hypothetical protein SAMN05660745_02031 [Corynebacterium glucuronolyticum]